MTMDARCCLCVLALVTEPIWAQAPEARVSVSSATVYGGQTVEIPVDIENPYPCSTDVRVPFPRKDGGYGLTAYEQLPKGQTKVTVKLTVPIDQPEGEYTNHTVMLDPCPNHIQGKALSSGPVTITVKSVPDTGQYPTSAIVKLSLTEKQYFDNRIEQLSELKSRLDNGLPENAANAERLDTFLSGIVTDALKELQVSEGQYDQEILHNNGAIPAFFGDFRARYQELLIELAARPRNDHTATSFTYGAKLVLVQQLKSRDDDLPNGEWPSIANQVDQTIKEHISAYSHVRNTGRITFNAVILSFPSGARIHYKKVVDVAYLDYSRPTDVSSAEFDLARWDFKFAKDGCREELLRIDPYEEKEPVTISVELHCKSQ